MLLTSLWLVPLLALGLNPFLTQRDLAELLGPAGTDAVTPAGAVCVRAARDAAAVPDRGGERRKLPAVLSLDHWRRCFGGRGADLLAVYAIYVGGLVVAGCLAVPPLVVLGLTNPRLAMAMGGLTAVFLFGLAVSLLGRLCGSFAAERPEIEVETDTAEEDEDDNGPHWP